MKKVIVITAIAFFLAGCGEQQKQESFNIQDLKLGMQKYEVEKICNGSLEFVATESIPDSNGYSKTTYRMWPNQPKGFERIVITSRKDRRPYQLTFIVAPPFTKEQCEQLIEQEKVTDPNEIMFIRALEGYRFDKLIGVSQDIEMIKLQALHKAIRQQQQQGQQQYKQNLQLQEMNNNLNRIQNQLDWQEMQNFQRQAQEEFYRMQQNR